MKVSVIFKKRNVSQMNIENVRAIANVYEDRTTIGYINEEGIYKEIYIEDKLVSMIEITDF